MSWLVMIMGLERKHVQVYTPEKYKVVNSILIHDRKRGCRKEIVVDPVTKS